MERHGWGGGREEASAAEGREEHAKLKPRPRGDVKVIFPNPTKQVAHSWKLSPITLPHGPVTITLSHTGSEYEFVLQRAGEAMGSLSN